MTAFLFDTAITGWNDLLNYQYNYDKMNNIAAKLIVHFDMEEISAGLIRLKANT